MLLCGAPASAAFKLRPVPAPNRQVIWADCGVEPAVGRFSGAFTCAGMKEYAAEVLIFQNTRDHRVLKAEVYNTMPPRPKDGRALFGALTPGEGRANFEGAAPVVFLGRQVDAPVEGWVRVEERKDKRAVYKVFGAVPMLPGQTVEGEAVVDGDKAEARFTLKTSLGERACSGKAKRTQRFKFSCK